jgi:hypothetical protein
MRLSIADDSRVSTHAARLTAPVLLVGALAVYDGLTTDEKRWLYRLAVLVAGLICMPLLARIRRPWVIAGATLVVLVFAHLAAFLVWAPFVHWH